jgi:hypothetical protein
MRISQRLRHCGPIGTAVRCRPECRARRLSRSVLSRRVSLRLVPTGSRLAIRTRPDRWPPNGPVPDQPHPAPPRSQDRAHPISRRRWLLNQLGLPISVGVAHTKHLAKIASQVAKPDRLVVRQPVETDCIDHRMDGSARGPRTIAAAAGDRGTRSRLSKLMEGHGSSRGWYQRSGASAKAVWGRCGCGRRSTAWRIVLRPQHRYQAPAPSAHR